MFILDNINNYNNFQFNFSNYFAIIIYTMASIGSSNSSKEGSGSGSGSGSVSSNMSRAQILTHPGDYFFVNPRTTMQDADLTQLLTAVQAQNITIVGPFTTDNYAFAAQQVRTAGEAGEY